MSLRPADYGGRSSRSGSGRTRDASRSRSDVGLDYVTREPRTPSSRTKLSRSSKDDSDPRETSSVPGAFVDEDDQSDDRYGRDEKLSRRVSTLRSRDAGSSSLPQYEVRTPGSGSSSTVGTPTAKAPSAGLSKLARDAAAMGRGRGSDESEEDFDEHLAYGNFDGRSSGSRHKRQPSDMRRQYATMPDMPDMPVDFGRGATLGRASTSSSTKDVRRTLTSSTDGGNGYVASPISYSASNSSYPDPRSGTAARGSNGSYTSMPVMPDHASDHSGFGYAAMPKHQYAEVSPDALTRVITSPLPEAHHARPGVPHSLSEQRVATTERKRTDSYSRTAELRAPGRERSDSSSSRGDLRPEFREIRPSNHRNGSDEDLVPPKRGRGLSVADARTTDLRAPSPGGLAPGGLTPRLNRLSVSGNRPDAHSLLPPGSPLLEAYKGTYQSISPMPSPMMLPTHDDFDLDDLPSLDSYGSNGSGIGKKSTKKRVKLYDAEGDAEKLAKALKHGDPRREPLLEVLPEVTHDQMLALKDEYKKLVKVSGKGVNLSKHINMKFPGNNNKFGQACYVVSLGRWESEAHWANFWYQEHSSNRELLIEALMGRSNADIREIKDSFKAKKYDDDLAKCLEKELKPDKFRGAVMLALEARRQEETDVYPQDYRNRDVQYLHEALTARQGGESTMIQIIVMRSDNHLREVLKTYERMHGVNFAKAALAKSTNLVGEVIAHILNGVINRPSRDSMLLHHAIQDLKAHNQEVKFRYELLTSRLIRLHWDRMHLTKVKEEYKRRYGAHLEEDIKGATRGDFTEFCVRLCET